MWLCEWPSESKGFFIFSIFGQSQIIWKTFLCLDSLHAEIDKELCHMKLCKVLRLELGVEMDQGHWSVRSGTLE